MLRLSNLKGPLGGRKNRKRIGRGIGSGTGKTSGKGQKGQNSRSGGRMPPWFEGGQMPLVRRIPKRGFSNYPFRKVWAEVNLSQLDRFTSGETIDPETLAKCGLARGRFDGIVILGRGELEVAVTVRAHRFSKTAAEKIEAAGGKAEIIHLNDPKAETAAELTDKPEVPEITTSESEATEAEFVEGSENETAGETVGSVTEDVEEAVAEATEVVSGENETVEASGDDDEATE